MRLLKAKRARFAISLISEAVKVFSSACSLCAHSLRPACTRRLGVAYDYWPSNLDRTQHVSVIQQWDCECVRCDFDFTLARWLYQPKQKQAKSLANSNSFVGHKVLLAMEALHQISKVAKPSSLMKVKACGCKKCIRAHNCVLLCVAEPGIDCFASARMRCCIAGLLFVLSASARKVTSFPFSAAHTRPTSLLFKTIFKHSATVSRWSVLLIPFLPPAGGAGFLNKVDILIRADTRAQFPVSAPDLRNTPGTEKCMRLNKMLEHPGQNCPRPVFHRNPDSAVWVSSHVAATFLLSSLKWAAPVYYTVERMIRNFFLTVVCVLCSRAVTDPRDGRRVALKKLPNVFQSLVSSKRVFRELKMLCFFKHENVSIDFCTPWLSMRTYCIYLFAGTETAPPWKSEK